MWKSFVKYKVLKITSSRHIISILYNFRLSFPNSQFSSLIQLILDCKYLNHYDKTKKCLNKIKIVKILLRADNTTVLCSKISLQEHDLITKINNNRISSYSTCFVVSSIFLTLNWKWFLSVPYSIQRFCSFKNQTHLLHVFVL